MMIAKKYPCRPWVKRYEHTIPKDKYFDDFAFLLRLRFTNIRATTTNSYIQLSKCKGMINPIRDNGRLVRADYIDNILITEVDFLIIKDFYTWDKVELIDSWYSKKDYLPKKYIEYILELYEQKTTLKGVSDDVIPNASDMYALAKSNLNSLFGVTVTDICQTSIRYEDGLWYVDDLTAETVKEKLSNLSDPKRWGDKKYFSSYSWGVYICCYGRKALWDCLKIANPDKCIYMDTDSLFIYGVPDFSEYNDSITRELKIACDSVGVDFNKTHPKDIKGKEHPLGIFDREDDIIEFKCIHSKAYCERRTDGKLYLTLSGVGKDAVKILNDDINNFRVGTIFDKDFDYKKPKMIPTYLYDMPVVTYPDGYESHYTKGINLRRTGYTIGNTDEFSKLLQFTQMTLEDIPSDLMTKMKGVYR